MKKAATLVMGPLFLLGACSSSDTPEKPSPPPTPNEPEPGPLKVDWENYDPIAQSSLDQLSAAKNCAGLQVEFDTADANDTSQKERVGDGNTDLMSYIDEKLAEAGCYESPAPGKSP